MRRLNGLSLIKPMVLSELLSRAAYYALRAHR